ncbi:MAG: amidohydrolase family protein, partial [Armatimonadetes bacterium]|nr:amidohydrolase family protein [Armatimonadota bacterium]
SGLGVVVRPGADRKHWVLKRHACLRLSLGTGGADMSTSFHRNEVYRQLRGAFEGAKQYQEMWEKYKKDLAEYKQKKRQWDDQQKKKEAKKDGEKKDGEKKEEKPGDKKEGDSELKEEPKKPQKPRVDPRNEVLVRAIDPKTQLLVRIEAHTADTVDWALELARDYKLRIAVDCGTEAARVAAALAQAKVPVFVGPVFRYGLRRVDYLNHSIDTAAELSKAGVTIAIASFPDPAAGHEGAGATRFLLEAAAFAAGKGLSRDQALRAVTLEPAKILGIDATVGSIEKGKAADLVILSGEPFEPGTRVERTMCDGAWIYQAKIE